MDTGASDRQLLQFEYGRKYANCKALAATHGPAIYEGGSVGCEFADDTTAAGNGTGKRRESGKRKGSDWLNNVKLEIKILLQ